VKKRSKFFFFFPKITRYGSFNDRTGAPDPSRSRAWIFTSFQETAPVLEDVQYLVYQRERCPETQRLHWQGYVIFPNPRTLGGVRKLLPGAHLEVRRGSHKQARDYCTKRESRFADPVEFGSEPAQGQRSDLQGMADLVLAGGSDRELALADPVSYLRYSKGLHSLRMAIAPPRRHKSCVLILWGPTGCGKSRWFHEAPWKSSFSKDTTEWWDGYSGEESVLLDEFYGQIRHEYMLKLLDRYEMRVQVKGGYAQFNSRVIVLTSNRDPRDWYSGLSDAGVSWQPQFFRRIDYEYKFAGGVWWRGKYNGQSEFGTWQDPEWEEEALPHPRSLLGADQGQLHVPEALQVPFGDDVTDVVDLTQE